MSTDDDLVPEGFDLQSALRAESTTPAEDHPRCPQCGSVNLNPRAERAGVQAGDGKPWYCNNCKERVEAAEPVTDGGQDPSPRYEQTDHEIGTGDVVVDLVSGKSLQVVSRSTATAGEHPQTRSDKTAAMFGADEDDAVYNCVFLPDGEDVRPPSETYAYPEGRLLRYPVEQAADGTPLQTHLKAAFLEDLAETAAEQCRLSTLYNIVKEAYTEDLAEYIHEWAQASGAVENGGSD